MAKPWGAEQTVKRQRRKRKSADCSGAKLMLAEAPMFDFASIRFDRRRKDARA
jgi:hypothetical protein